MESYRKQMEDIRAQLQQRSGLVEDKYKYVNVTLVPIDQSQCHSDYFETLIRDDGFEDYFVEIRTNVEELLEMALCVFQKFRVDRARTEKTSALDMYQSYFG